MSLINQMLKDLEKRSSRDLETSESLRNNISWETRPDSKRFNFQVFAIVVILLLLLTIIAYLFWERSAYKDGLVNVENKKENTINNQKQKSAQKPKVIHKPNKHQVIKSFVKKPTTKPSKVLKKVAANQAYAEVVEADNIVDLEEIDNEKPLKLKKKHRPLNNKQLAEIEYNKGYRSLQQGRMRQGKEQLRDALSYYAPHIKAREMLSGIYIKSGRYVEAASLLHEGITIVPDYSLFAKLYARVLLEQNNPQLAIQVLERGSTASDVESDYHALLAATYQRVKNHGKAIEIYVQLVKANPTVGIWWLGLAISLEKSGKNKEALEAYQRVQKTGNLKAGLVKFTNNRVSALKEMGFPEQN